MLELLQVSLVPVKDHLAWLKGAASSLSFVCQQIHAVEPTLEGFVTGRVTSLLVAKTSALQVA